MLAPVVRYRGLGAVPAGWPSVDALVPGPVPGSYAIGKDGAPATATNPATGYAMLATSPYADAMAAATAAARAAAGMQPWAPAVDGPGNVPVTPTIAAHPGCGPDLPVGVLCDPGYGDVLIPNPARATGVPVQSVKVLPPLPHDDVIPEPEIGRAHA